MIQAPITYSHLCKVYQYVLRQRHIVKELKGKKINIEVVNNSGFRPQEVMIHQKEHARHWLKLCMGVQDVVNAKLLTPEERHKGQQALDNWEEINADNKSKR